jgi:hypothetical protein
MTAAPRLVDDGPIPTRDAPREESLRRRVLEFLLVGGLTPLLFPLSFLLRGTLGLSSADYAVGFTAFYAAYVINDPHFAVTYLLFYEDGRARAFGSAWKLTQRLRWLAAGVLVPVVLAAWAGYGLFTRSAPALGLMMELMFALVGWHYVKQGFGVMATLAARRGLFFGKWERVVLLTHCFSGWAFAWANPAAAAREVESKGVIYTALAHPAWLDRATHVVFLASLAGLVVMLARKWKREGPLPLLSPLTAMLVSIWSWSVYSSIDPLVMYVTPALHSVQYLYFVWLLRGNQAKEREGPPWFERSAKTRLGILAASALGLGFVLFHGAPALLDSALVGKRDRLLDTGPTPYFAALYAFVNIHHYFMDFVIWRKDNPLTRYLRA